MKSILLIEDDISLRQTLAFFLEEQNFRVLSVETGWAGIETARRTRFDLVITDLSLPDVSGLVVISTLRAEAPDTRVIALSGGPFPGSPSDPLEEALRLGARIAMKKPFEPERLLAAIAEQIGQSA